jgi:hypothetical protein
MYSHQAQVAADAQLQMIRDIVSIDMVANKSEHSDLNKNQDIIKLFFLIIRAYQNKMASYLPTLLPR